MSKIKSYISKKESSPWVKKLKSKGPSLEKISAISGAKIVGPVPLLGSPISNYDFLFAAKVINNGKKQDTVSHFENNSESIKQHIVSRGSYTLKQSVSRKINNPINNRNRHKTKRNSFLSNNKYSRKDIINLYPNGRISSFVKFQQNEAKVMAVISRTSSGKFEEKIINLNEFTTDWMLIFDNENTFLHSNHKDSVIRITIDQAKRIIGMYPKEIAIKHKKHNKLFK